MVVDTLKQGQGNRTAILCSGGLDSAVLMANELHSALSSSQKDPFLQPVYVNSGFSWESTEQECIGQLLTIAPFSGRIRPIVNLSCPVADTYPESLWALSGLPPSYNTEDEEVYLVGRNVILLAKVSAYCAVNNIGRILIGPLAGNPFPDASPEFLTAMESTLSMGLAHRIQISAPFGERTKVEVIKLGHSLGVPFEFTLSCMNPVRSAPPAEHCGKCSKCRERLQAFDAAHLTDPARYTFRPNDVWVGT